MWWVNWSGLAMPPKILVEHLTRPHLFSPMLTPSEEPPRALPMALGHSNAGPFLNIYRSQTHCIKLFAILYYFFIMLVSILFFCF